MTTGFGIIMHSKAFQLIIRTFLKWQKDKCLDMGAALAYYTIFSLFPLLLIILSIVGFFLGPDTDVYNEILNLAKNWLPPLAYNMISSTLLHLNQSSIGAGVFGFTILLFSASNLFSSLARFVNIIWQTPIEQPSNNNLGTRVLNFLKERILGLVLVLGTSILMLLSVLYDIATQIFLKIVYEFNQSIDFIEIDRLELLNQLEKGTTFLILSLTIMGLFKILPSTFVSWSDVWLGSLITAGFFMLFQNFVSLSIFEIGNRFLSYGLFSGVMVFLLWIYLTYQLFFLGSEFTYIYAHLFGSRRQRKIENMLKNNKHDL
jgi:membrane protein